jgi:hypothetical protein
LSSSDFSFSKSAISFSFSTILFSVPFTHSSRISSIDFHFSHLANLVAVFHNISSIDGFCHFSAFFVSSHSNVVLNAFSALSNVFLMNIIFCTFAVCSICFSHFTFSPGLGSGCSFWSIFDFSSNTSITLIHLASSSTYVPIDFFRADW